MISSLIRASASVPPLVLALFAALCFTLGGVFMKYARGVENTGFALAFLVVFCVGAVVQSVLLKESELGPTYILILGMESALAFGFGSWFFGEQVTFLKLLGLCLVVVGIALLKPA